MSKVQSTRSTFHYGSIKISIGESNNKRRSWSTFHYGSIKIGSLANKIMDVQESTFHYGSIKMSLKLLIEV